MTDKKTPLKYILRDAYNGFGAKQVRYVPVEVRTPHVLEMYPPKEGWGIVVEARDPLGFFASGMELQKAFISSAQSGEEPNDYLRSRMARKVQVVFEAKLIGPDGRIRAIGSLWQLIEPTDRNPDPTEHWAIGETKARNRLYMALGFGSDQLLGDSKFEPVQVSDDDPAAFSYREEAVETPAAQPAPASAAAGATSAPAASAAPQLPETPAGGGKASKDKEERKKGNYRNQIKHIIELRGLKDVVIPEDLEGLKKLHKELSDTKSRAA